jgi:hypothetical protein
MGNIFSKKDHPADALRDLVERPGTSTEISLTGSKITSGLDAVASALHADKSSKITIVAVGGAVNTLYLKSRPQTTDVDFFYRTKLASKDVTAIVKAAGKAAKAIGADDNWLNNHTAVFIDVSNRVNQARSY